MAWEWQSFVLPNKIIELHIENKGLGVIEIQ
jgi:hypothetical protein